MTKAKKHWYDFLFRPVDVEGGPVKIKRVPACVLLIILLGLLIAAVFAFKEYMRAPEPVRHHKIDGIRGALR
jgi:hypothetical protein